MNWKKIRWGPAFGGMLLAEVGQIGAAFGWVAFYAYVLHPGETQAFYESYAQVASPWVSVLAGPPIFYWICRWIGAKAPSRAGSPVPTAMALFALFVVVELAAVVVAGSPPSRILWIMAVSISLKFLACLLGARSAASSGPKAVAEPA